jgi:glycerophosphoryl diester phosphodiesterase
MILIGHRGCSYPGYNQNTIRAFDRVTREGVPAIEFDVQLSGDGELVIVHNLNLEEVSNGYGKVSQTDSKSIKSLYAGDPARGKDRIPFLSEVFEFFASQPPEKRPAIHLELKGDGTGKPAGELLSTFLDSGRLQVSDVLASSFNWQELGNIQQVCPALKIALLDGAIRRTLLSDKLGVEADHYFERIFAYGCEQYMLPRFPSLAENLEFLEEECADPQVKTILAEEIRACLEGKYYTEDLLDTACEMKAESVNLWYRTVSQEFIDRAHDRGLAVLVYTVNAAKELQMLEQRGVDGIFTDFYMESVAALTP